VCRRIRRWNRKCRALDTTAAPIVEHTVRLGTGALRGTAVYLISGQVDQGLKPGRRHQHANGSIVLDPPR